MTSYSSIHWHLISAPLQVNTPACSTNGKKIQEEEERRLPRQYLLLEFVLLGPDDGKLHKGKRKRGREDEIICKILVSCPLSK